MRKLAIVFLLVAAACHRKVVVQSAPSANINTAGAATPKEALQKLLTAAKAEDVQGLALAMGSADGPFIATQPRDQVEMRAVIMFCYLHHDSYTITREIAASGGDRIVTAELKYKTVTRSADFTTSRGKPNNLWYVKQFQPTDLNEICAASKR